LAVPCWVKQFSAKDDTDRKANSVTEITLQTLKTLAFSQVRYKFFNKTVL
jgi:hypothetical protein